MTILCDKFSGHPKGQVTGCYGERVVGGESWLGRKGPPTQVGPGPLFPRAGGLSSILPIKFICHSSHSQRLRAAYDIKYDKGSIYLFLFNILSSCRYAYIEFADQSSLKAAMELDEGTFRGRIIKVSPVGGLSWCRILPLAGVVAG